MSDRSTASKRPKKSTTVRAREVLIGAAVRGLGWVAPDLAGRLVAALFVRPGRHEPPAREGPLLARASAFRVRSSTGEIAAWSWGEGPIVLLVHGWEGRGAQLGAVVEPLLDRGYRVVAFDGPAHGVSAGSVATATGFADAVLAVQQEVGPVHGVMAHSFGAIAVALAGSRGMDPGRLVLVSPGFLPGQVIRVVAEKVGLPESTYLATRRAVGRIAGASLEAVDAAASRDQGVPLLVVHDDDDRVVEAEHGQAWASRTEGGTFLATAGLGHRRILRDPAVVDAVVDFLTVQATSGSVRQDGTRLESARTGPSGVG